MIMRLAKFRYQPHRRAFVVTIDGCDFRVSEAFLREVMADKATMMDRIQEECDAI